MAALLNRSYTDRDVLSEASERISTVFDNFDNVIVSVSSGKDSTVLYWLCIKEAERRNRSIKVFFLDQEAEYQSSIDLIEKMMVYPYVVPLWYQVPLYLTNATSYEEDLFYAWEDGAQWMRKKHPISVDQIEGEYPKRFYNFFHWMEKNNPNTAFLVGIRSEESLNRLRAVVQHAGWGDVTWSTKTPGENTYRFYPLYDWGMGDVWKFISDNNLPYNSVYDKMFRANKNYYRTMRVSNLIHEKSFKCLTDLQMYEPDTFNRLVERISGIHVASIYANEKNVFSADRLPSNFPTWKEFRDYLLQTTPLRMKDSFVSRFSSQPDNEEMCRRQVRQILLNDHENNLKVESNMDPSKKEAVRKEWWNKL